jgi:hypothetical protein
MPSYKAKGNTATTMLLIGDSLAISAAVETRRWTTQ